MHQLQRGDFISFNENPPTLQPSVQSMPPADPRIGSNSINSVSYQGKTIQIYKKISNGIEFYDNKRKWHGVKEEFQSEAIAEKTNGQVDMRISGNYTLTSLKLFRETTLAPKRSDKLDEKENAWLNLASTEASWPIASATIEGNPSKKKCAKENGLNVYLKEEYPNALIYEKVHVLVEKTCLVNGVIYCTTWWNS
ncbi:5120_t:CDS:2 [Ambispora leptoticha]|uniref:5120_t:CDS:1 n=1 Tax=Ambispora leptoticha TaxID=144679 RepID=A0A9N9B2P1_9GLOM|nr:5120_t:CDS:2 [Ambispora leptoticha]